MAMNAPLLSTQMRRHSGARAIGVNQPPLRLWNEASETAKSQLAASVAEMVKRMAQGSKER